jgi:CBS domain-containing protein
VRHSVAGGERRLLLSAAVPNRNDKAILATTHHLGRRAPLQEDTMDTRDALAATSEAKHVVPTQRSDAPTRYELAMHRYLAVIAETPTHPAAAQTGDEATSTRAVSTGYTAVTDVMTSGVVAAHQGATFKEIVQSLARNRIGSVPVIDDDRKVVGMVTESDLLAHMAKGHPSPVPSPHRIGAGRDRRRKEEAEIAADLMTSPAVTIQAEASVADAAKLAAKTKVHRLPVVDSDGVLVGIVSRGDLLKSFLRKDDDIRTQIVDDVIIRSMALDPTTISTDVEEGIVTLSGKLERRSLIPQLADEIRELEGVVAVHSTLGYDLDDTAPAMPYRPLY